MRIGCNNHHSNCHFLNTYYGPDILPGVLSHLNETASSTTWILELSSCSVNVSFFVSLPF